MLYGLLTIEVQGEGRITNQNDSLLFHFRIFLENNKGVIFKPGAEHVARG